MLSAVRVRLGVELRVRVLEGVQDLVRVHEVVQGPMRLEVPQRDRNLVAREHAPHEPIDVLTDVERYAFA